MTEWCTITTLHLSVKVQFPSLSVQSHIIHVVTDRQHGHMVKQHLKLNISITNVVDYNVSKKLKFLKHFLTQQHNSLQCQQFSVWPNVKHGHHLYVWHWIRDKKVFLQNLWMSQRSLPLDIKCHDVTILPYMTSEATVILTHQVPIRFIL